MALCNGFLLLPAMQTMLVEKVAAEAEFSLLSISPSMILSKWAGDSEKAVSQVFDLARTMQPSILFLVGAQHYCSAGSCHQTICSRTTATQPQHNPQLHAAWHASSMCIVPQVKHNPARMYVALFANATFADTAQVAAAASSLLGVLLLAG
jgi:hypothetical protein